MGCGVAMVLISLRVGLVVTTLSTTIIALFAVFHVTGIISQPQSRLLTTLSGVAWLVSWVAFILVVGSVFVPFQAIRVGLEESLEDSERSILELEATNLQLQEAMDKRDQAEAALREREARYRRIFQTAAVSIWEEDVSGVRTALGRLRDEGVTDFRAHFDAHPEFIAEAASQIRVTDVNDATLHLYGADTKEEMLASLDRIVTQESLPMMRDMLLAFAEGSSQFTCEHLRGNFKDRLGPISGKCYTISVQRVFRSNFYQTVQFAGGFIQFFPRRER